MRNECLNEPWFLDLKNAQEIIESWRLNHNNERPHRSLGGTIPAEFTTKAQIPYGSHRASVSACSPPERRGKYESTSPLTPAKCYCDG